MTRAEDRGRFPTSPGARSSRQGASTRAIDLCEDNIGAGDDRNGRHDQASSCRGRCLACPFEPRCKY